MLFRLLSLIIALLTVAAPVVALDRVQMEHEGEPRDVSGRVLLEAEDGGILLQSGDGAIWAVPPQRLLSWQRDDEPFEPYSHDEIAESLLAELPDGFQIHKTNRYLICYNTSRAYAQWCGALFERLYLAFTNYWSRKGLDLVEPEFPLVAIVFADVNSYREYARPELGEAAGAVVGYYSLRSNRIMMYDLTGIEALRQPGDRRGSPQQINLMLSRPQAEQSVATIVHEATHQIAFNCGLQTRFADIPLWVSEGLAVYFETPDLTSRSGWRNIGGVNYSRLATFRRYLSRRGENSLEALVTGDDRFRDHRAAADAYAEAWALHYFLIRQRGDQYHAYIKKLSDKKPLLWDEPEERLREFREAFGDLDELDADFLRYMQRVR